MNKNTIKKLLTTASTLAVIASSSSALATDYYSGGAAGAGKMSTGANIFKMDGGGAGAAIVAGNHSFILGSAHGIELDVASGANTYTVNIAGRDAQIISVGNAITFAVTNDVAVPAVPAGTAAAAAVAIAAANANAKAKIAFSAANDATLSSGAANISQVDFNNQATTLTVTEANAKFSGTNFTSTGGNNGKLAINADVELANVTFAAVPAAAGTAISDITVADGKTLTLSGNTDASNVVNGITVDAAGKVVAGTGTNVGDVTLSAAGLLTLNDTAGAGDVIVAGAGTVDAKGTGTIASVALNNAGAVLNIYGGEVTAVTSNAASQGAVNVYGNAKASLTAGNNYVKTLAFKDNATLTLTADSQVDTISVDDDKKGTIKTGAHDLLVKTFGSEKSNLTLDFENNNNTLVIQDGGAFYGRVISNRGAGAIGTVLIQGDLTANGQFGSDAGTLAVVGVDVGKKVDFGASLVRVAELALLGVDSKATITAAHEDMSVVTGVANAGELIVNSDTDIKLQAIGDVAGNALKSLKIGGKGNLKIVADAAFNSLEFTAADASSLVFEVETLDNMGGNNGTFKTTKGGTIAFRDDSTLQVDLGTDANSFTALKLVADADKLLDLQGKKTYKASILSDKANRLTVTGVGTAAANTAYGNFGTLGEYLKKVTFAATGANNTTATGSIFAQEIDFAGADTNLNVSGAIIRKDKTAKLTFSNNAHKITLKNGLFLMPVVATAAGDGQFVFEENAAVSGLGSANSLGSVTFSDTKEAFRIIQGDINSKIIKFGAGTYGFLSNAMAEEFAAQLLAGVDIKDLMITTTDTKNIATIKGGATTFAADTTVKFYEGQVLKLENNVDFAGKTNFKMHKTAQLDASKAAQVTHTENLTITPYGSVLDGVAPNASFIQFKGAKAAYENKQLNLSLAGITDKLTKYTLVATDADTLGLKVESDIDGAKTFFAKDAKLSGNALSFAADLLDNMSTISDDAKTMLAFITDGTTSVAEVSEAVGRIVASPSTTAVSTSMVGASLANVAARQAYVSAGDEDSRMNLGLWAEGFGAKATQKTLKGDAGYNAKSVGGTVGIDTMIADHSTIGIAVSYAKSDVKFKDVKSGDKAKAGNLFFSVYGSHNIADNWFLQGAVGFGSGNVKSTSKRLIASNTYDVATGKFDVMSFAIEGKVGYNFRLMDTLSVVPTLGLRYVSINEGGYTETGSVFNRTVTKKSADKLTGIFGSAVQSNIDLDGTIITPEAHAFVHYDLKTKNPKVEAKLDGISKALYISGAKGEKLAFNVGAGVKAKTGIVEYGIGYDAKLAKKFVSHQGTLRLKVDL